MAEAPAWHGPPVIAELDWFGETVWDPHPPQLPGRDGVRVEVEREVARVIQSWWADGVRRALVSVGFEGDAMVLLIVAGEVVAHERFRRSVRVMLPPTGSPLR